MSTFAALRVHRTDSGTEPRLEQLTLSDLGEGDVVIAAEWSDLNYKDALAVTGKGRILRKFPLVAGIDVAGRVLTSEDPAFTPGQAVVVTGCGLSETHDGGLAERVRVPSDFVVPLPDGLTTRDAMAIGTAGFTAALAIVLMERNGQRPEGGPIAVTGATGGVGSLATNMLSGLGYEVHAITGKSDGADYLFGLGASQVLLRQELDLGSGPLGSTRFGGAIDNLGGDILDRLLATTKPFGNVASIGLAASHKLQTTVMPLILRGVNLLGVNSVFTPTELRRHVWSRLATDLRPSNLDDIVTNTIGLDEVIDACPAWVEARVTGRTLVRLS